MLGWFFLFGMSCCAILSLQAAGASLKAVYGDFNTPPAILTDRGKVSGGVLVEIYQQLSAQLGLELELIALPRKRISEYLLAGSVDVYCRANPAWYPNPLLQWSPPLFAYHDLIISREEFPSVEHFKKMARGRIGTILGYRYPQIDFELKSQQLQRQDSVTPEISARRFYQGEFDYLVLSELEAEYLLPLQEFKLVQLEKYQLHCVYSPALTPEQRDLLNQSIQLSVQQGRFLQLLQKYKGLGLLSAIGGH